MRVTEIEVEAGKGGSGSALVPVPGTAFVLTARQDGSPRPALLALDLDAMTVRRTGARSPGDLRDAALADDGSGWVAGLYGLAVLRAGAPLRPELVDVPRLPRYPGRITRLTPDLLSVGNHYWKTSVLLDEPSRTVVGRLRVPLVEYAVSRGGTVELLDLRRGWHGRLDPATRRLTTVGTAPPGSSSARAGDGLVMVAGTRVQRLDLADLSAPPVDVTEVLPGLPAGTWTVAGAGPDGVAVLTGHDAVLVLDPAGGADRVTAPRQIAAATYVPARRTVVAALTRHRTHDGTPVHSLLVVELDG